MARHGGGNLYRPSFRRLSTHTGFSLLPIGANSFYGGFGHPEFGDVRFLIVGTITLVSCLIFNIRAKSFYKQLSVLGLFVGYAAAYFYGMVDLSRLDGSIPCVSAGFMPYSLEFHYDAIFSVFLIFLVSATETLGDTSALAAMGFNRRRKTGKYPVPLPWTGLFLPRLLSSGVCRLHLSARMWGLSP